MNSTSPKTNNQIKKSLTNKTNKTNKTKNNKKNTHMNFNNPHNNVGINNNMNNNKNNNIKNNTGMNNTSMNNNKNNTSMNNAGVNNTAMNNTAMNNTAINNTDMNNTSMNNNGMNNTSMNNNGMNNTSMNNNGMNNNGMNNNGMNNNGMNNNKYMNYTKNFVRKMFELMTHIKLYHWKTNSYASHKATDELLKILNEIIDKYVETLLGKTGYKLNMVDYSNIPIKNLENTDEFEKYIKDLIEFLLEIHTHLNLEKDVDLLNLRDEMIGDLNRFLYLLRLK